MGYRRSISSCNGFSFALSWYLDASCDNWDALIADDYTAVMPLPYRKNGENIIFILLTSFRV